MGESLHKRLGLLLLFGVVYAGTVQLSLAYVVRPESVSVIWLPSGLLLGVLLRRRMSEWPAIVAMALAVGIGGNLRFAEPWSIALLYNGANVTEALISGLLIQYATGPHPALNRVREVLALALVPALLGEPISAAIAAFGQHALLGGVDFWQTWNVWWSSGTLGELVIAPAVLTLPPAGWRPDRAAARRGLELLVFTAATAALSLAIFSHPMSTHTGPPLGWITFPLIALAAVRLGPIGAAVPSAAYGLISGWATVHGRGPFAFLGTEAGDRALWLNLFVGFAVLAALLLAAADAEYRRATFALGKSEQKYRSIFENALDAIFRTTPDGRYGDANPATARVLGYESVDQLYDEVRNVTDLYADPEQRREILEQLRKRGSIPAVEVAVRRRDGTTGWLSMSLRVVRDEETNTNYVEGVAEDITERKSREDEAVYLQRQLLQSQKMESLGTLAGGIAHDFNNILAAIVGMVDLAKHSVPEDHDARQYIGDALKATERAAELVQQVLTFSQRQTEQRWPQSLVPIAKEAARFMRAALPASVEIRTEIPDGLPTVLANPTQVRQVLVNLMTNAGQAMRDTGGELTLALEELVPDAQLRTEFPQLRDLPYVRITVADTGHGMDARTVSRIFEPFFTTKQPGEGTGLGLAMVHGIVEQHDGAITVESRVGEGTTFRVYLPALETRTPHDTPEEQAAVRGNGERVLFVDDEPMLARVGEMFLTDLGYRVTALQGAEEALAAFQAAPDDYDLVVTDLTMPNASGLELADEIRFVRPDTPVILTTGFRGSLTDEVVREHGIREVLVKPYSGAHLAAALRRALGPAS
jgi:PAS domain S-box-containing protein